jgi:hypothetical protein
MKYKLFNPQVISERFEDTVNWEGKDSFWQMERTIEIPDYFSQRHQWYT